MKTTKLSFKMRPKSTWLSFFFFFCVLLHIMIRASNGDFDGDGSSSSPRSRSESWLRWKRWLPWVFASAAAAALYCWSTFTEDFYNCGGGSEAILLWRHSQPSWSAYCRARESERESSYAFGRALSHVSGTSPPPPPPPSKQQWPPTSSPF